MTRRRRGRGRRRGAARGRRARTDGAEDEVDNNGRISPRFPQIHSGFLRFPQICIPELGLLLDLTEAVQVVVDPGAGAVVEHAVVAQVGHRGQ